MSDPEERIEGWKCIAAELGVAINTAKGYERMGVFGDGKFRLPVRFDYKRQPFTRRRWLETWKADSEMTWSAAQAVLRQVASEKAA